MNKILVVEDDKYLINAYRVKFTNAGFQVKLTTDGDEALAALPTFQPDVILLDLVMPKRDGFSFLEEIKKKPTFAKIPVIIASNLGQQEDIKRGIALGAVDYIIKSDTSIEDVVTKIKKAIA